MPLVRRSVPRLRVRCAATDSNNNRQTTADALDNRPEIHEPSNNSRVGNDCKENDEEDGYDDDDEDDGFDMPASQVLCSTPTTDNDGAFAGHIVWDLDASPQLAAMRKRRRPSLRPRRQPISPAKEVVHPESPTSVRIIRIGSKRWRRVDPRHNPKEEREKPSARHLRELIEQLHDCEGRENQNDAQENNIPNGSPHRMKSTKRDEEEQIQLIDDDDVSFLACATQAELEQERAEAAASVRSPVIHAARQPPPPLPSVQRDRQQQQQNENDSFDMLLTQIHIDDDDDDDGGGGGGSSDNSIRRKEMAESDGKRQQPPAKCSQDEIEEKRTAALRRRSQRLRRAKVAR